MNMLAHLLISAAVFGRSAISRILGAAVIGAILPDFSLYLMAGSITYYVENSTRDCVW